MGTNTDMLAFEDWSIGAVSALATPHLSPVFPVVGPDENFLRIVRGLTTWYEFRLELQSWLKAGEDTLWRIDTLFS